MRDLQAPGVLRAALQFLKDSDVPAEHKAVLMQALTYALRTREAAELQTAAESSARMWQATDVERLRGALQDRAAHSWQHADELLMQVAAQLQRSPSDVRKKATELGLGAAVDYAIAKSLSAAHAQATEH